MSVTIWHNPRCSKSRATLKLLQDRGIEPEVRLYLDRPPTKGELAEALAALGLSAVDLVRTSEPEWKLAGLGPESGEADVIAALAAHPKLIERPVVFCNGSARIGRPPEAVLDLFEP